GGRRSWQEARASPADSLALHRPCGATHGLSRASSSAQAAWNLAPTVGREKWPGPRKPSSLSVAHRGIAVFPDYRHRLSRLALAALPQLKSKKLLLPTASCSSPELCSQKEKWPLPGQIWRWPFRRT